jgi:hypothetical protein
VQGMVPPEVFGSDPPFPINLVGIETVVSQLSVNARGNEDERIRVNMIDGVT